jgi:casein kinase 1
LFFIESLATLLTYVRALRFDETPDYDYCRELLDNALVDEVDDGVRDWMLLNNGKGWQVSDIYSKSLGSDFL